MDKFWKLVANLVGLVADNSHLICPTLQGRTIRTDFQPNILLKVAALSAPHYHTGEYKCLRSTQMSLSGPAFWRWC